MKFWLTRASDFIWRNIYMWITILTAVVCTCDFLLVYTQNGHLFYMDTDCYMRAVRIVDWVQNFQWPEKTFPYTNPPFNLHFTRICDVIWLLLSLPFMLFAPLKEAIFYGGFLFSPLFLILSMLALTWCFRTFLPTMHHPRVVFFTVLAISLCILLKEAGVFGATRPDHHSMMDFILMFNVAVVLCSYDSSNLRYFIAAGVLSGIGLWASSATEGLLVAGSMFGVLCYDYVFARRPIKEILFYSLGLFVTTTIAWMIDPPLDGWYSLENTRLSIIQAVLTALIFLVFCIIAWHRPQKIISKIAWVFSGALISGLLMVVIFGWKQFSLLICDDFIHEYFLSYVAEIHGLEGVIPWMSLMVCIVSVIGLLYISKGKLYYAHDMAILVIYYAIISIIATRFWGYFVVLYVVVFGLLCFALLHLAYKAPSSENHYKYAAYVLIMANLLYAVIVGYVAVSEQDDTDKRTLHLKQQETCLSSIFEAPRLIFEHNIYSIGSPYHSDVEGLRLNKNIWLESDENVLKDIFRRYHISCVIVPSTTANFKALPNTFWYKIASSIRVYPWLIKKEGYYAVDEKLLEEN